MFKCYKYVSLYEKWCTHLQYSRFNWLLKPQLQESPHYASHWELRSYRLHYTVMSGSDTEELPTAGDLNNKHGSSYLCNVAWEDAVWRYSLYDSSAVLFGERETIISIIFLQPCRCCLYTRNSLVVDNFQRVSYLRKADDGYTAEQLWSAWETHTHSYSTVHCTENIKGAHVSTKLWSKRLLSNVSHI